MKSLKTRIHKLDDTQRREMSVHIIEMVPDDTVKEAMQRYTSNVRDILPGDIVRLHSRVNKPLNAVLGVM